MEKIRKEIRKILNEISKPTKFVYIRFGMPNRDEKGNFTRSREFRNGIAGPLEGGISVFKATEKAGYYYVMIDGYRMRSSLDELIHSTRDVYVVEGKVVDEGSDGEPVLGVDSFKIVKKIDKSKIKEYEEDFPLVLGFEDKVDPLSDAEYYLDDFYAMDSNHGKSESRAIREISEVLAFIEKLDGNLSMYPLRVYRGLNTSSPYMDYDGNHWSLDKRVAEGFGNQIYVGLIKAPKLIDMEQTARARIMNPGENEIYVKDSDKVEIVDVYEK